MKPMRKTLVATLLLLSTLAPESGRAETSYGIKDLSIPAVYPLGPCATTSDLDCVESIEIISASAGAEKAIFDRFAPEVVGASQNGNLVVPGVTYWKIGSRELRLNLMIETPEHVLLIRADGTKQRGAALRGFITIDNPFETRVRTKVRTSWLRPMNIQIKMSDANFSHQKITGGNLWTFEGSATKLADYTGDWMNDEQKKSFSAKADIETTEFSFNIHHAGKDAESSYWPPICAEKGYTVQSHNTNATGDPQWNSKDQSLEFSIYAPHLRADGTKNVGYFQLWTSHEFLNCKFPDNDLTTSPKLIVQILYEDGSVGVATTSVSNSDGKMSFTAAGFHFSAPKVIVKRDQTAVTVPASSSSSTTSTQTSVTTTSSKKVVKVYCVKGKRKILLKPTAKACPKGYKRA